jgi:hypothetical protein
MGLLDDARALQKTKQQGPACSVRLLIEEWEQEPGRQQDLAELLAALDDQRIQHTVLSEVLRKYGVTMGDSTIGRHRMGKCRCGAE